MKQKEGFYIGLGLMVGVLTGVSIENSKQSKKTN
jgi:hypothetical protein|tara:strand:- start:185 stop:286 length:102 start_codon:yes stop_codon:yes gene_type:complete